MPGSRSAPPASDRITFPFTASRTACQRQPGLFSHEATSTPAARADIEQAKRLCSGCPIVTGCLKWALAHPTQARLGVWAGTTARQRTHLRQRLADRLGTDWVTVVADHEDRLREQRQAARHAPLTVHEARIVRLDRDLNGPMPPARWRLTPGEQQRNVHRLLTATRKAVRSGEHRPVTATTRL
ncbi:WhiB family transcriptional regulator [Streptomyces sp. NPDC050625]|uniref:WhiB family transcriptional regulator n=1 Tax=Streptomyces sp. NPDC050625 TaxID=3154629 RepID=UPI00343BDDAF